MDQKTVQKKNAFRLNNNKLSIREFTYYFLRLVR